FLLKCGSALRIIETRKEFRPGGRAKVREQVRSSNARKLFPQTGRLLSHGCQRSAFASFIDGRIQPAGSFHGRRAGSHVAPQHSFDGRSDFHYEVRKRLKGKAEKGKANGKSKTCRASARQSH